MSDPGSDPSRIRRLIVLGSTGSIGVNTLRVVENLSSIQPGRWQVVGLAGGANVERLAEQAAAVRPQAVAVADAEAAERLRPRLWPDCRLLAGPHASRQLVESVDADLLVSAIVGAAGLPATLVGIERGMDVALANKETLVAAGELVVSLARKHGVHLLPVDSEHSAIFQCLDGRTADGRSNGQDVDASGRGSAHSYPSVKRIVLTASGGPFRTADPQAIRNATVEQALKHPTWNMGPKITIDSATMMNKALEIIEAHWLFGLSAGQIQVIIHPQSIAHSFVEFADHSILAQLGTPDMKTPIQYALTWPDRAAGCSQPLDWTALARLDFEQPDERRFPSLKLAYAVIERGGTSGAILNAANEQAVDAFLNRRITFGQIVDLSAAALDAIDVQPVRDLQAVHEADRAARAFVRQRIHRYSQ